MPDDKSLIFFAGIDNARFKRQVTPGDQLTLESTEIGWFAASASSRCGPASATRWLRGRIAGRVARLLTLVTRVHPTAIVAASAELAGDVVIGPYTVVGAETTIGAGTSIGAHVVIADRTSIGRDNRVFQFASVGEIPQDRKYTGDPTRTASATTTSSASS